MAVNNPVAADGSTDGHVATTLPWQLHNGTLTNNVAASPSPLVLGQQCKEEFPQRPELRVNTLISGLVVLFNKSVQVKSSSASKPTQSLALCEICCEKKCAAVKSCLICMTSYCETHLEPHKRVLSFKKHKLIEPVENLVDYICQKHERPLELFCKDDQTCVCQFCTEGDHRTHDTVPIEEVLRPGLGRATDIKKTLVEVHQMIQERLNKIRKHSVVLNNRNTEKEKADVVEIFSALMRSIERSQAELLKVMEEKQKAAERQAEEFIKDLEQEITELKRRNTELEQLSHTEDHLHLLQIYPSLCSPPHTQDWTDVTIISRLSVETVRRALSQIQETLSEEMEKLNMAVDVMVDPHTAHPTLILSNDGKQIRNGDKQQNLPDNPERFEEYAFVLGKEGFSSGRLYYEVQVRGKSEWLLGMAKESIKRKGTIKFRPEKGCWCISLLNGIWCEVVDSVCLTFKDSPDKVGVFVDYDEGLISFYDVDAKFHIYSFTGQTFTEKLYPLFCPDLGTVEDDEDEFPLIICPVTHMSS
ncbi:E3 ubiquitin-protein ligase TRIM39-like [Clarias gariepinus]|uniref:E3 ubiquitin-protein ligase TRIM39-like n=1 Tax=Clarias gariepinus TaxID=13013 RepID=UPI00234C8324|nr:E3 ubiquitin-protein ligase TRIM39-like [Clarias gariepinus]